MQRLSRPALDGLRQEKFKYEFTTDPDLSPQTGKGNLAVNEFTLTHLRHQVKSDFGTSRMKCAGHLTAGGKVRYVIGLVISS